MTAPALIISNLSCQRGDRHLFEQLSFELNNGQLLHIIGPNGCGKSSLLRLIAKINNPPTGDISWQGNTTANNLSYLESIAYIGHKDGLKNELTACENLEFYQTLNDKINSSSIDQYLHQLDILHCAELLTSQLSFGQRRRLAFARLLVKYYPLWILDEPFTGIDQQGRLITEQLCAQHLNQGGMIILSNHASLQDTSLSNHLIELNLSEQVVNR